MGPAEAGVAKQLGLQRPKSGKQATRTADDEATGCLELWRPDVDISESAKVVGSIEAERCGAAGPNRAKAVKHATQAVGFAFVEAAE